MKLPRWAACAAILFILPVSSFAASEGGVWRLYRALVGSGRVEVHVASEDKVLAARTATLVERLEATTPLEFELRPIATDGDPSAARLVLATVSDRMGVSLARRVGAHVGEEPGFELLGRRFDHPSDVLLASFEDPRREGLPVTLLFGNTVDALSSALDRVRVSWRPSLTVWSEGQVALQGPLRLDGHPLGQRITDLDQGREELASELALFVADGVDSYWTTEIDVERVRPFAAQMAEARARVVSWFGGAPPPRTNVLVLGSAERHAALGGGTELGIAAPRGGRAQALCADGIPHDGGAAVARATALAIAGDPAPGARWMLEALGVAASDRWWGRDLDEWVARLAAADLGATPAELLAPSADRALGPHRAVPLRAYLLRFVLMRANVGDLHSLWKGEVDLADDASLATSFATALAAIGSRADVPNRIADVEGMRGGVALVDHAAGPPSDFLDPELAQSLRAARELGARSVVVYVRAAASDGSKDFDLPPHAVDTATPDMALAAAVGLARAQGLDVSLALVPTTSPSGSFADSFAVFGEAGWEQFFDSYGSLVRHYALLAELLECETFSVGEGLLDASRTVAADGARDAVQRAFKLAKWQELVADTRRIFTGALTYTASHPVETERIAFWPDLDFIGLAIFPTHFTGASDPPTDDGIRYTWSFALDRAGEIAREQERPAFITAIGFPSAAGAWARAAVPTGDRDEDVQRRALGGLADVLEQMDLGDFAALNLWSWCADPVRLGSEDRGFSPQNKAAESELPRILGR